MHIISEKTGYQSQPVPTGCVQRTNNDGNDDVLDCKGADQSANDDEHADSANDIRNIASILCIKQLPRSDKWPFQTCIETNFRTLSGLSAGSQ